MRASKTLKFFSSMLKKRFGVHEESFVMVCHDEEGRGGDTERYMIIFAPETGLFESAQKYYFF